MADLEVAARNAAVDAVVDLIDVGTTDANGDLVIDTSGDVEVAILAMSNPAFGDAAAGTATAAAISDDTNATGGTAAKYKFQDRDNARVMGGDVGESGSGADLILSSTAIGSGDTVSVSSFTVTQPAS